MYQAKPPVNEKKADIEIEHHDGRSKIEIDPNHDGRLKIDIKKSHDSDKTDGEAQKIPTDPKPRVVPFRSSSVARLLAANDS